jgi:Beta-xylosidase
MFAIIVTSCFQIKAQASFKNPIFPGFYPDPSICRVGDHYYPVNSSFEQFRNTPVFRCKGSVNRERI